MPAKLIVTAGAAQGSEFPIQDPVLRIGSGGQCEFCLRDAGLAAHAVTLEYRDDGYLLHNRGEDPIQIAGQILGLRDSARWSAGQEADFGNGLILRLDIDGDPAPAKAAGPAYTIEYDADENDDAAAKKKASGSSKTLPLVAIAVAVLLGAWMLMEPPDVGKPVERPISYSALMARLEQNKVDAARGAHSFRATLQRAAGAEVRRDFDEARTAYGSMRDRLLLHPKSAEGKFSDPDEDELWKYVTWRLSYLYGGATP